MNELGIRPLVTVLLALGAFGLGSADPAAARPRLYTGSIEFRISTFDGCTSANSCFNDFDAGYPFPFGANISYPSLQDPSSGNLASVSGSGPAAIGLGSNQITLHTSLCDTSPPASWSVDFAGSSFSGGHAAGWLSAGGAPGSTSSTSITPVPYGGVGVSFSGTSANFGGTLNLLGSWNAWYDSAASLPSYGMPLTPIGGVFGGTARAQLDRVGGTAVSHTVWGFPWTTGSVSVWAPEPSRAERLRRLLVSLHVSPRLGFGRAHLSGSREHPARVPLRRAASRGGESRECLLPGGNRQAQLEIRARAISRHPLGSRARLDRGSLPRSEPGLIDGGIPARFD